MLSKGMLFLDQTAEESGASLIEDGRNFQWICEVCHSAVVAL